MNRWTRQFRSFAAIGRWWRDRFSTGGKMITVLLILGLPVMSDLNSPFFLYGFSFINLLLVSAVVGFWFRPTLAACVMANETAQAGEPCQVPVRLTNRRNSTVFDCRVRLFGEATCRPASCPEVRVPVLAAAASQVVHFEVSPLPRGVYAWGHLSFSSMFPLQLIRFSSVFPLAGHLTVLPRYRPLTNMEALQLAGEWGEDCAQPARLGVGGTTWVAANMCPECRYDVGIMRHGPVWAGRLSVSSAIRSRLRLPSSSTIGFHGRTSQLLKKTRYGKIPCPLSQR